MSSAGESRMLDAWLGLYCLDWIREGEKRACLLLGMPWLQVFACSAGRHGHVCTVLFACAVVGARDAGLDCVVWTGSEGEERSWLPGMP